MCEKVSSVMFRGNSHKHLHGFHQELKGGQKQESLVKQQGCVRLFLIFVLLNAKFILA